MSNQMTKKYLDFCKTEHQKKVLKCYLETKSSTKTAKQLQLSPGRVRNILCNIKRYGECHGYSPENDIDHPVPDQYIVDGVSTLYNKDGKISSQWIKTKIDKNKYYEFIKDCINELAADVKKVKHKDLNHDVEDKLIVYPLSDLHIGMLSWAKETGDDYNLKIAEDLLKSSITKAIDRSPVCSECLICNLGDFFHVDNLRNETERSHNALDVDSRYSKIFRIGIKMIRYCIELALEKHEKVYVINSMGNHDDMGALVLSVALNNIYENEPRIKIFDAPKPRHYFRFGNTLIGATHGHDIKMIDLPLIMATEMAKDWGETKYHYWYTGHIHSDNCIELGNCKVESFRTIAAKDAWTNSKGYLAGRDFKCIVIDKQNGEIERYTFSIV